jgi:hypothetical protein
MNYVGDRDGKSKTSSAVDSQHYPDLNGREGQGVQEEEKVDESAFSHAEIAHLAHGLWENAGRPDGTEEKDWLEAERLLFEERRNRTDTKTMAAQAGSVQR